MFIGAGYCADSTLGRPCREINRTTIHEGITCFLELPWNGAYASYAAAGTRRITIKAQCSDRGAPNSLAGSVRVSETGKFAQQTPRDRCSPTHIPARTALRPYSTRENAAQTAPQPSQPPLPGDFTSTSRSLLHKTGLFGNKIRAAAQKIALGEPQPTAPILLMRWLPANPRAPSFASPIGFAA